MIEKQRNMQAGPGPWPEGALAGAQPLELGNGALPAVPGIGAAREKGMGAQLSEARAFVDSVAQEVGRVLAGVLGAEWTPMSVPEVRLSRSRSVSSERVWGEYDKSKTLLSVSPALLENLDSREISLNYARQKSELFRIDGRAAIVHELTHWFQSICCVHAIVRGLASSRTDALAREHDPRMLEEVARRGVDSRLAAHGEMLLEAAEHGRGLRDRTDRAYASREAARERLATLEEAGTAPERPGGLWGRLRSWFDSQRLAQARSEAESAAAHYEFMCREYWGNPSELEAFGMQYRWQDRRALEEYIVVAESILGQQRPATRAWFRDFSSALARSVNTGSLASELAAGSTKAA